ncbi:MAG: DoxX family protein [Actinomycetota bacterium]
MGLLLLRVVVGSLFIGHGTQKLFGWFGGGRIDGSAGFLQSMGFSRPRAWATVNGLAEAGGGLLLALGLLTPFAAAALIGVMLVASFTAHRGKGIWNQNGGSELPLVMATSAATVAFVGPGTFSLDAAMGIVLDGALWGGIAVLLGLVSGAAVLAIRANAQSVAEQEERQLRRAA